MQNAVLEDDGVTIGRERAAQRDVRFEHTILIEIDDAQVLGAANLSGLRLEFVAQQAQQRGLTAAIRPDQADARASREGEGEVVEQLPAAEAEVDLVQLDEALGFAAGRGEVEVRR